MSRKHTNTKQAARRPAFSKQQKESSALKNLICNTFLLVMFTVFPLFVTLAWQDSFPFISLADGYREIRHQKYYFFLIVSALTVIAEIMLLLTETGAEKRRGDPETRSLFKTLSVTDWAVLAFVLSCAVSTVFSAYTDLAVVGESEIGGRNNGLILMLFYAAVYFTVTRCFRYKEYLFVAFACVSGVVFLLAVLNGFYLDPLGMVEPFEYSNPRVYQNFMTTIGNKNMFSSYICVTLPAIIALFVNCRVLWHKAVYLICTAVGAMAVVVCDSDSVVLGMGAFIAVYLVVYARRPERLKRFLLALTVLLSGVKLLQLIAVWSGGRYKELSAIPYKLMFSDMLLAVIGVTAALTAALYLLDWKKPGLTLPKAVPIALGSLFGLAAAFGVGVIVYYSAFDLKTDLGDWERLLRFNDAWGTHRGIMWDRALREFGKFSFFNKLFGTGPETFFYTFSPYFGELYRRFGDGVTDAAHNEYINYLTNIGIIGLASYLAFTGSALVAAFRRAKRDPSALVFASAVIAYMAQATVNISLPIATPLFIIFVALCACPGDTVGAAPRTGEKPTELPRGSKEKK